MRIAKQAKAEAKVKRVEPTVAQEQQPEEGQRGGPMGRYFYYFKAGMGTDCHPKHAEEFL